MKGAKVLTRQRAVMRGIIDRVLGRRAVSTPPQEEIFIGPADFEKTGEEFLRYFTELGGLQPNARVLDVGCGIGRMAWALTRFLSKKGSYEGFDIVADGIRWCKEEISSRYPNFHFQHVDVYNKFYNPQGIYKASEYQFPYESESFDFTFLTSVFTHVLPQDMENYFSEIARVLKKDGRCLTTFFLLNTESLRLLDAKVSREDFKYECEGYRTTDKETPETVVAYEEGLVRELYEKYKLKIMEPIRYGLWCGRKDFLSYQDIIIAAKK
jgi:ubiquinone/menaquinone biosynthesis C-methylase UbiE